MYAQVLCPYPENGGGVVASHPLCRLESPIVREGVRLKDLVQRVSFYMKFAYLFCGMRVCTTGCLLGLPRACVLCYMFVWF